MSTVSDRLNENYSTVGVSKTELRPSKELKLNKKKSFYSKIRKRSFSCLLLSEMGLNLTI